jgi:outer membrane protein TolC
MEDHLTKYEAQQIAKEAAEEAVKRVFDRFGVDLTSSRSVQEFQRTLDYANRSRRSADEFGVAVKRASITVLIGGLAFAFWWGIKAALNG